MGCCTLLITIIILALLSDLDGMLSWNLRESRLRLCFVKSHVMFPCASLRWSRVLFDQRSSVTRMSHDSSLKFCKLYFLFVVKLHFVKRVKKLVINALNEMS